MVLNWLRLWIASCGCPVFCPFGPRSQKPHLPSTYLTVPPHSGPWGSNGSQWVRRQASLGPANVLALSSSGSAPTGLLSFLATVHYTSLLRLLAITPGIQGIWAESAQMGNQGARFPSSWFQLDPHFSDSFTSLWPCGSSCRVTGWFCRTKGLSRVPFASSKLRLWRLLQRRETCKKRDWELTEKQLWWLNGNQRHVGYISLKNK